MALHKEFPRSPYEVLNPDLRWFPAAEELRSTAYEKLLPPLVAKVREEVKAWRDAKYAGASATSRALLTWWFETAHTSELADGTQMQFRYYFAQREAVETVIWLHDVRGARDKYDLLRFDGSGAVSSNMFDEDWPRFVVKMATGAGKTKVLSLLMAWCYFHKLYEANSTLARNFLLIAPNIIVLDRLRTDFDGLRIFFNDPVLPDNGHAGQNWRDDFQVALHIQDDVRVVRPTGNIFLTNIHRVYLGDVPEPSLEDDDLRDYFLAPFGAKPVGKTNDSNVDLGEVVREIDELAVFNDEAHHIHDNRLAWFQCIQDIHHRMLQKDLRLTIQVDVTATPRHENGAIFVQTVSDYYIRVGTQSREPSPEELSRLFQQRGTFRAELRPVSGAVLADLDLRRLKNYFVRVRQQDVPADDDEAGWATLLFNTEIMVEDGITVSGMLLFGRTPNRFLPQAGIDAAAFPGNSKDYGARERSALRGPLTPLLSDADEIVEAGLVEQALAFVQRNTAVVGQLEEGGARREEVPAYPREAVREAVVNALVHRDYLLSSTDIELTIYDDRLEIVSPGRLPNGITPARMLTGCRAARNQLIKDVMRDYRYLENSGMGVPRKIVRCMREHNGTEPVLIEAGERFTLRLLR